MTPITVIVPVHNAGTFIRECAGSIIPQLPQNSKLILINDASTDNSDIICKQIAQKYPNTVIHLQAHGTGVSNARNIGIKAAQTPYIAFCDADDSYAPGAIPLLINTLDNNPQTDIAIGTFSRSKPKPVPNNITPKIYPAQTALKLTLYRRKKMHESAWAKIYRRSLFTPETLFTPHRRYEDLEQTARIYLKAKYIAFINTPIYHYRKHPDAYLANWSDSRLDALWAVDTILENITQQAPELIPAANSRKFSAYFNIFALASAHNHPAAKSCWQHIKNTKTRILLAPHIRLKNRIGATIAHLGQKTCATIARIIYR